MTSKKKKKPHSLIFIKYISKKLFLELSHLSVSALIGRLANYNFSSLLI